MRCPEIRAFLHPFLDGELEVEKNVVVLQHLELCSSCRIRFEDEKRLLERLRDGIRETCPEALRAKLRLMCGGAAAAPETVPASPAAMPALAPGGGFSALRILASAAAVILVFLGVDPFCLLGCPTVHALALEHASPATLELKADCDGFEKQMCTLAGGKVEVPCPNACALCGLVLVGGKRLACPKGAGALLRYRDGQQRVISFVQWSGAEVHPWLKYKAGPNGFIQSTQDGCRFVGWRDDDGKKLCGLVADESVPAEQLMAAALRIRASE